ncbi:2'-5' RNA ligase family protein, partial [Staphylococcus saprophyticus]
MILGLALIPSKAFQDEVNAYRKRYDAHYATIMPHITIKGQFKINDGDLESVKETIKSKIEGIPTIDIHATKASNFAPITNVIYFKVEKTETLERLFNQFNNGDFYGVADHTFVPHFT